MSKASDNEFFVGEVQRWLGINPDEWAGIETQTKWLERTETPAVPVRSPQVIPDDYWPMLTNIESGGRAYVKAATSSGSGLYQFLKATWIGEGGAWGNDNSKAFGGLRPTEGEQLARARTFTEKNAKALQQAGIGINKASLYAAHFLGVGTAIKAINGDVNHPVANYVSPEAVKANQSILGGGKTVGDFLSWLFRKTGDWAR